MASGGSSGRTSSGLRSFDFGSDDVLSAYDDFNNQDRSNGKRSDPSAAKDFHESRMGRPLVNVYGQQDEYPKEEIINAVEKCMKKYADNLLRHLEGISGRLSQLEIYCYKLERSIDEFRADMIRDQSDADTKLKSLEKHLQEVHRSIQILRDKQDLAETQKELLMLQSAPKEPASPARSQKSEEAIAPPSVSEPKRHDDISDIPNQHLALALPHQIPARAPDQSQLPIMQQQQQQQQQQQPTPPQQIAPASLGMQHDRYALNHPFYPQHSQALQPEIQYVQPRPQIHDSTHSPPRPRQQPQVVNQPPPQQPQVMNQAQTPPQPFPQYQQQWSQPSPQQFTQQVVAPTHQPAPQAQLSRPHTPPAYIYAHQPANPETFAYSTDPQPGGNRPEVVPFGYGRSGSTINISSQPPHQASSQSSFGLPSAKASGYASPAPYPPQSNVPQGYSTVYSTDGSRVQTFQPGSYPPPPSNIPGIQNQQLPPGNISGSHHPGTQLMRSHPYADVIEKAVSTGYPREQVVGVVNRMAESGQPVDFNALLDRLNSRPAAGGPARAW